MSSNKLDTKLNQMTDEQRSLFMVRHSAEHVLTMAMKNLGFKFLMAMGPATDDGFYFDFELLEGSTVREEDFAKIEAEMQKIIDQDLTFKREVISADQARNLFADNPYKQEWISEAQERNDVITVYHSGDFVDLCAGPHVESTKYIPAFKLLSIAGAYWRGSEKNKMLTRIYGTAFSSQQELGEYLHLHEEAQKRDHRKLGKELGLFIFHETAPGSPYWLENGLIVLNQLLDFWRTEHKSRGYHETATPLVNKKELWEISGHWDHYKNDMFLADMGDNEIYGIKPMNCPNAMIIFGSQKRSYRELPLRLSDSDVLHRYEKSGTLNGLLRVRSFRQDDSHNFIIEDQIKAEYSEIMDIAKLFYGVFGLEFSYRLGTRPDGFLGDVETWNKAEQALREILDEKVGVGNYKVLDGDGAFYGPKVDILMKDALGREWQMGTIQLDFQLPKRFELTYTHSDGSEKQPVVVHRVIYGSLERFIGILIEHFYGAFPVWLHPNQVTLIPIGENQLEYAFQTSKKLEELVPGIRLKTDTSNETLGKKIRNAQLEKTPYVLVVGNKEATNNSVNVRLRTETELGEMKVDEFADYLKAKIATRSLVL